MAHALNAVHRARLIEIVKQRSFLEGSEMKLASGRTSTVYFNMKPTMLDPEGAHLIGTLIGARLADETVDRVGGLEMGAVPLATAVATVSQSVGRPLPAFFVRKQTKEHGTQALIEGLSPGETLQGAKVVVLEDVTTTGGSALKAVDIVRGAGAEIVMVLTIVDRQEGAGEAFASQGLAFDAILRKSDFTDAV